MMVSRWITKNEVTKAESQVSELGLSMSCLVWLFVFVLVSVV